MKNLMLAAAFLGIAGLAYAESAPFKQHRSPAYQQGAVKPETKQPAAAPKRQPGQHCKLYQRGTRQHAFPQYEIGNPNRPACPAA